MHVIERINNDDFTNKHDFLGTSNLIPGSNHCDANRIVMFDAQMEQLIQIEEPQVPLVFSGFENEFSKYSSGYLYLEGKWKVLTKIVKNDYQYAMIIKKIELSKNEKKKIKEGKKIEHPVGEFHVVFRTECENLTEKYGYKHDNKVIDNLEKGDIFKDEYLYKDYNRDDEMNLHYGRNVNVAYLSYKGLTTEDSLVISESLAKKMSSPFVKNIVVTLNTNDILINMYGNKKFYKCFPDIGEDIKFGYLCGSRRIQYDTAPVYLSNMRKILSSDTTYKCNNGKVIDIEIISNIDDETILDNDYNKQINKYHHQQQNYYQNFVNYLSKIVETKENKLSDDLIHYYNRYKMLSDPNVKFRLENNLFDHLIIKFTVLTIEPLVEGSKITGRYGNKGVVSKILPDDEMPKIIDFAGYGNVDDSEVNMNIEAICNPLGIPNRINIAQNLEHETNYNSKIIRYELEQRWEDESLEELKDFLLDYIEVVNENQYKIMKDYLDNLEDDKLEELLHDFIINGIPIWQPPFWNNIDIQKLTDIYEYTEAEKCIFKDIENPIIFGELYMFPLKHTPFSKFSARSMDQLSIKNLPVKTDNYKAYKTHHSSNPIKLGKFCRI